MIHTILFQSQLQAWFCKLGETEGRYHTKAQSLPLLQGAAASLPTTPRKGEQLESNWGGGRAQAEREVQKVKGK